MDELIERMLAVRSGLAPINRPGVAADLLAAQGHVLAVAFHRELLQIRRKALEILLVREHRDGLRAEEVVVPDRQQTHENREIVLERSAAEMVVDLVKAAEH